jgi:GDP-4-dehydro-6-deoxy-D-mannose reductase
VAEQFEVCGTALTETSNLKRVSSLARVFEGDVRDRDWVRRLVSEVRPEIVFHLAAQSLVTVSWEDPEETLRANVFGTLHLLEAMRATQLNPVVLVVGSSAVLGPRTMAEMPLLEDADFRPTSAYAVSKIGKEMLGYYYWKAFGMRIIRVRPFNMTGPGKFHDACSDFARGISEVEYGMRNVLDVGNLETVRDFTDGRDAVRGLLLVARRGAPGEVYNLCSGTPVRMADVLARLISMSHANIEYRVVTHKLRPYDDPVYVGDNSKLLRLGWQLEIPFHQTLSDLLDYWRNEVRSEVA